MAPCVLQIIPRLNVGGAEKTVLEMTEALVERRWRALIVAEEGRMVPSIEAAGGVFYPLPVASKNPLTLLRNAAALRQLIIREKVDIVHARSRAPAWSALWASRAAGVPFLTTYHGAHSQKTAIKRFYNSVMARGDVVIANSDYTARQIMTHHGRYVKKMALINRGVDLEKTDLAAVTAERCAALREAWGVREGQKIILMPARLSKRKGHMDVIGALQTLKSMAGFDQLQVIMAGAIEGSEVYHQSLLAAITEAGLEGVVKCVGFCGDMPAAFALSDLVLAVSSKPESFGRVVAESLAMGLPIVLTDVGAQGEIIKDETGALAVGARAIQPGDRAGLAAALAALAALTEDERAHYSQAARQHIIETYSITRLKNETMAVYEGLLSGK